MLCFIGVTVLSGVKRTLNDLCLLYYLPDEEKICMH